MPLAFNRHAQQICSALEECKVLFKKFVLRAAVDFKHPKRFAITLKNDVHSASNAMMCK